MGRNVGAGALWKRPLAYLFTCSVLLAGLPPYRRGEADVVGELGKPWTELIEGTLAVRVWRRAGRVGVRGAGESGIPARAGRDTRGADA